MKTLVTQWRTHCYLTPLITLSTHTICIRWFVNQLKNFNISSLPVILGQSGIMFGYFHNPFNPCCYLYSKTVYKRQLNLWASKAVQAVEIPYLQFQSPQYFPMLALVPRFISSVLFQIFMVKGKLIYLYFSWIVFGTKYHDWLIIDVVFILSINESLISTCYHIMTTLLTVTGESEMWWIGKFYVL